MRCVVGNLTFRDVSKKSNVFISKEWQVLGE